MFPSLSDTDIRYYLFELLKVNNISNKNVNKTKYRRLIIVIPKVLCTVMLNLKI